MVFNQLERIFCTCVEKSKLHIPNGQTGWWLFFLMIVDDEVDDLGQLSDTRY